MTPEKKDSVSEQTPSSPKIKELESKIQQVDGEIAKNNEEIKKLESTIDRKRFTELTIYQTVLNGLGEKINNLDRTDKDLFNRAGFGKESSHVEVDIKRALGDLQILDANSVKSLGLKNIDNAVLWLNQHRNTLKAWGTKKPQLDAEIKKTQDIIAKIVSTRESNKKLNVIKKQKNDELQIEIIKEKDKINNSIIFRDMIQYYQGNGQEYKRSIVTIKNRLGEEYKDYEYAGLIDGIVEVTNGSLVDISSNSGDYSDNADKVMEIKIRSIGDKLEIIRKSINTNHGEMGEPNQIEKYIIEIKGGKMYLTTSRDFLSRGSNKRNERYGTKQKAETKTFSYEETTQAIQELVRMNGIIKSDKENKKKQQQEEKIKQQQERIKKEKEANESRLDKELKNIK